MVSLNMTLKSLNKYKIFSECVLNVPEKLVLLLMLSID